MSKFPLTTVGVQSLLNELYALPQAQLQLEADAAGADFRLWVKTHFELTTSQEDYLENIDEEWINDAAAETKYFLENRLPIAFYKEEEPKRGNGKDRGKLLDLDQRNLSGYSKDDGYLSRKTLTYSISYPVQ